MGINVPVQLRQTTVGLCDTLVFAVIYVYDYYYNILIYALALIIIL